MNEFFTWGLLATYAGAALATGIITQFLKGLFSKLPTQALAYFVALLVLLAATFFSDVLSASTVALAVLNAAIVATATSGTYDTVKRLTGGNGEDNGQ